MTDEKLDQILKQALSPEIDDSEIQIQRKGNHMNKKKMILSGLAACIALALVFSGINFNGVLFSGNGTMLGNNTEEETASGNIFAITAYAAELPANIASGDVINLKSFEADSGTPEFLTGRFAISGNNINIIKITTDKCNIYSAVSVNGEEKLTVEGSCYEGKYKNQMSFGMSVPTEMWSKKEDIKEAFHEEIDQVNGAKLTIEVTFSDGSTDTHHYKLTTGKIFVPRDENGSNQWDNLTRFVRSKQEPFTYGYLIEKID